jgi:hypothetical protein
MVRLWQGRGPTAPDEVAINGGLAERKAGEHGWQYSHKTPRKD